MSETTSDPSDPRAPALTKPTGPSFAQRGRPVRYGASLFLALGIILFVWATVPWLGQNAPFAPLFFVIIAAAYCCGPGPTLLATFAGALLIDLLFLGQPQRFLHNSAA